ncbi:MAG: two-component system response regulator [Proteobacteria bacterium ST_bin11]|nr:MAG: two-component system response regulator [Proteobacteria bacterium ST_bin11]
MPNNPILIVDDEPANLAILREILESDYRLVFARNGQETLLAIAKHRPSLILLDIKMPGMDGYQICNALKADPATEAIPVIFVTALSDLGNEEQGFAVGCVDYLSKPVVPSLVRARVKTHLSLVRATQLEKSHRDAIYMLGEAGHYNDNDTGVHVWRMAAYAKALAINVGWNCADADLLEFAATMHDTGKIGVPDAVLSKPGALDADEWRVMRRHCQIGYDILSKSDAPVFKLAAEVALCHHEKWDGSGYPQGLANLNIPESVRIVGVADVFDALTMRRPYKEAWPVAKAVATIREAAGQHFDPAVVTCFLDIQAQIMQIKADWAIRESAQS